MDQLDFDQINKLKRPIMCRFYGEKDFLWEVETIETECALIRFYVCGLLDVKEFSEVAELKDGTGEIFDPDIFWVED